jgi:hypothetical protein
MKSFVTLVLLFLTVNLFAQVEKPITRGHFLIGGGLAGMYTKSHTESYQLVAEPSFGAFFADHWAIGISVPFQYYQNEGYYMQPDRIIGIGFGPFLKCYLNFGLFFEMQTSLSLVNYKYESHNYAFNSRDETGKTITLSPGIGYAIFLNQNIAFETSLHYQYNKSYFGSSEQDPINNVVLQLGFQIFL